MEGLSSQISDIGKKLPKEEEHSHDAVSPTFPEFLKTHLPTCEHCQSALKVAGYVRAPAAASPPTEAPKAKDGVVRRLWDKKQTD